MAGGVFMGASMTMTETVVSNNAILASGITARGGGSAAATSGASRTSGCLRGFLLILSLGIPPMECDLVVGGLALRSQESPLSGSFQSWSSSSRILN
jgi:hypothetical protein